MCLLHPTSRAVLLLTLLLPTLPVTLAALQQRQDRKSCRQVDAALRTVLANWHSNSCDASTWC
jgi:hypothetical protein